MRLTTKWTESNYEASQATAVPLPSVDSSPPLANWDQNAEAVRQVIPENLNLGKEVSPLAHPFGGGAMSEAVKGLGTKKDGCGAVLWGSAILEGLCCHKRRSQHLVVKGPP